VIGEVTAGAAEEIVLVGHPILGPGTGALDDGAGCAIAIETGGGCWRWRSARGARCASFSPTGVGLPGGRSYAETHADELVRHATMIAPISIGRVYRSLRRCRRRPGRGERRRT
jgi:hypothetical protein